MVVGLTLAFIALVALAPLDWEALAGWGYLGLFLVTLLNGAAIVLAGPGLAATFLAARVWPPLLVGLVAGTGTALGEVSGYLLGWGGAHLLDHWEGRRLPAHWRQRLASLVTRHWFWLFFLLSALPNPFLDLAGLIAGWRRLPLWQFLLPVWLGKTLRMLLIAHLGAWSLQLL